MNTLIPKYKIGDVVEYVGPYARHQNKVAIILESYTSRFQNMKPAILYKVLLGDEKLNWYEQNIQLIRSTSE